MSLTPFDRALMDHVQDVVHEVAEIVAGYRKQLEDQGMDRNEAWAMAQRMEERLLGPVFDGAAAQLQPSPWEDIEALFVAAVDLQLAFAQGPTAEAAVRYMMNAGVRIPDITFDQCVKLAGRSPMSQAEIRQAFTRGRSMQQER